MGEWVYYPVYYWDLRYCTSVAIGNTMYGYGIIW